MEPGPKILNSLPATAVNQFPHHQFDNISKHYSLENWTQNPSGEQISIDKFSEACRNLPMLQQKRESV